MERERERWESRQKGRERGEEVGKQTERELEEGREMCFSCSHLSPSPKIGFDQYWIPASEKYIQPLPYNPSHLSLHSPNLVCLLLQQGVRLILSKVTRNYRH